MMASPYSDRPDYDPTLQGYSSHSDRIRDQMAGDAARHSSTAGAGEGGIAFVVVCLGLYWLATTYLPKSVLSGIDSFLHALFPIAAFGVIALIGLAVLAVGFVVVRRFLIPALFVGAVFLVWTLASSVLAWIR
jgi:hypothetical protein